MSVCCDKCGMKLIPHDKSHNCIKSLKLHIAKLEKIIVELKEDTKVLPSYSCDKCEYMTDCRSCCTYPKIPNKMRLFSKEDRIMIERNKLINWCPKISKEE